MINPKDISVIVQGAINKTETPKTLASIRKYLPQAEIILSTWTYEDVSGLDYDILVLNEDPGAVVLERFKSRVIYNNLNRQLLSTKSGLEKATGKYALKLRSDLILTDNKFLDYFDKFQKRSKNYNLFEHKILTSTLFTRFNIKCANLAKRINIPFHISDWWFFGLREDLNKYFLDTQLVQEPDFTRYFEGENSSPYGKSTFKFAPEQYFAYECFHRNYGDIFMQDAADCSEELMAKFREILVNNFIVLEYKQSGIYLNKYNYSKDEKFAGDQYIGLYNFYRYETEYKKYCDNNYKILTKGLLYENEKYGYALLRFYKHIFVLFDSNTKFFKRIEQLFFGIPISVISLILMFLKIKSAGDNNGANK